MKILLVEDDTALRFAVAEWLRMENFEVVEARTGDEAATILSSILNVDLVLTDVQMPGNLSGLGLAQLIKQKFPEIPVIVASGATSGADALNTGADAFFTKPYDLEKLSECIAKLMPHKESDREKKKA